MGMIWKGTHVLIKGLTADNAYQSKNQALRSKELPVELRNRFASSHRSEEEFRKKSAALKGHRSMQSLLPLMEEVQGQGQGRFICHIHNHTEYNQQ